MAQGSPQTIVQSIEHAVEAAMQAVQVAQPQHMVHHMPQQAQQAQAPQVQVNLCQKLLFLHQLTHNMTTHCSLNYKFNT